jgi:hypothetical protein
MQVGVLDITSTEAGVLSCLRGPHLFLLHLLTHTRTCTDKLTLTLTVHTTHGPASHSPRHNQSKTHRRFDPPTFTAIALSRTISPSRGTTHDTSTHHGPAAAKNHRSPACVSVDTAHNPRPPANRPHNVEYSAAQQTKTAQRTAGGEDDQCRPGHTPVDASCNREARPADSRGDATTSTTQPTPKKHTA